MSYIFGGGTGRSYEEIKRDQAVAQAMLEQSMQPATTIGDGIAALGNAWGGRMLAEKSDKRMAEGRKRASEMFEKVLRANRATTPSETSPPTVQTKPLAAPDAALPNQSVIEAIIQQESAGNPSAVSPKGAGGLMQIMPATARDPGYGVPNIYDLSAQMGGSTPPPAEAGDEAMTQWLADPANAAINQAFGTQYFNAMKGQYGGDTEKALAAYNAGPGAVDQYGGVPPFDETQAYVKAITGSLGGGQPEPATPPAPAAAPPAISPELLSLLSDPYLDDGQRSVVQALLQQQIAANAPPKTMSPYQQAQIGLQRDRLQAQLDGRLKTGNNVTVDLGQKRDSEMTERGAKAIVDRYAAIAEQGDVANQKQYDIGVIRELLATGEIGGTADYWQAWAKNNLGVDTGVSSAVQAFEAVVNRLVPTMRPPGSGQMSDRDVQLFKESLPQLINSPEGNELILQTMQGMVDFERAAGDIAYGVLLGEIDAKTAREQIKALPDPLDDFRGAMKKLKTKPTNDPAELRRELETLRGG